VIDRPNALTDLRGFRRQLIWLAGASAAVVAATLAVVAQLVLSVTTSHTVDRVIEDRTNAVIALADAATGGSTPTVPDRGVDPGVAVYDSRGRIVAGSAPPSLASAFAELARTTTERQLAGDRFTVGAEPFRTPSGARGVVVSSEALAPYEHDESQALEVSIAAGILIVLLAVAVATWISHRALSPVADMARTAEEWSEHDLERRFDLGPPTDEIRELAHTLDGLLEKVGHAIRAEQRLTSELAHELRTPLTVVQATADLLALRTDLAPDLSEDVEGIRRAARTMAATITVLLEIARRPSSERAAAGTCSADDVLAEASRRYDGLTVADAESARIDVPLEIAMRALGPVLDNSARLADRTTVTVECDGDLVDLVVSDDGPGVADVDVLFRPGAVPGRSGLGLALARRIARGVGGDVLFRGDGEARGATFVVRLPRA